TGGGGRAGGSSSQPAHAGRSPPARGAGWPSVIRRPVQQIDRLLGGDVLQPFAALLERGMEADRHVLHLFVGLLRATEQQEMLSPRQPLAPVLVVQPNAEEPEYLLLFPLGVGGHEIPLGLRNAQEFTYENYTPPQRSGSIANGARAEAHGLRPVGFGSRPALSGTFPPFFYTLLN